MDYAGASVDGVGYNNAGPMMGDGYPHYNEEYQWGSNFMFLVIAGFNVIIGKQIFIN